MKIARPPASLRIQIYSDLLLTKRKGEIIKIIIERRKEKKHTRLQNFWMNNGAARPLKRPWSWTRQAWLWALGKSTLMTPGGGVAPLYGDSSLLGSMDQKPEPDPEARKTARTHTHTPKTNDRTKNWELMLLLFHVLLFLLLHICCCGCLYLVNLSKDTRRIKTI